MCFKFSGINICAKSVIFACGRWGIGEKIDNEGSLSTSIIWTKEGGSVSSFSSRIVSIGGRAGAGAGGPPRFFLCFLPFFIPLPASFIIISPSSSWRSSPGVHLLPFYFPPSLFSALVFSFGLFIVWKISYAWKRRTHGLNILINGGLSLIPLRKW